MTEQDITHTNGSAAATDPPIAPPTGLPPRRSAAVSQPYEGSPRPAALGEPPQRPRNKKTQNTLWLIGIFDTLLIVLGLLSTATYQIAGHAFSLHLGGLGGALAIIAVINFLGFYWFYQELRDAIAAAVVLTYIILLACMFNTSVQDALEHTPIGSSMLTSLTTLTATIGAFYFAGRSYERAAEVKAAATASAGAETGDDRR